MRELRRAAHTAYSLHYHFVFTTKYRKPVLVGDIEILQGHVRPDHVHLLLSAPPHLAPSRVMQAMKGKPPIISSKIIDGCGRHSGGGTCGGAAISWRAAAM